MATVANRTARRTAKRVRSRPAALPASRARLSVFRSSKHIYAQVIDDAKGVTLASASSLEKDMRGSVKTGANKDGGEGGRQADRRARDRRKASRTSCSTAAATCFMAGSRRWPTPPARAV